MLGYVIAFLAGGYLIPASMHFVGVWRTDRAAPDSPTAAESFVTALMEAVLWPMRDHRYEAE